MAKCEMCGKQSMFGNQRSHSMHATSRRFKPNLQRIRVLEKGVWVRKTVCAKCVKTLAKA